MNALGYRTTSVYDAAGQTVATMNPLGALATNVYDAAGRAVAAVNPLGYRTTRRVRCRGPRDGHH